VAVTNNSNAISFAVAPLVSMVGRFFSVEGHPDVFRVLTHTGGVQAATLDSVYTGPTDPAAAYTIRKLEYDMPADFLRCISPMRAYHSLSRGEVEGVDLLTLDAQHPLSNLKTGLPTHFALVTETKIRFSHAGGVEETELMRVEFDYHQKPSDLTDSGAEEPLIPLQHRNVLADATLFYLLEDKSDNKAGDVGLKTKAGLQAMRSDNRARVAQTNMRRGHLYARAGSKYRGNLPSVLRTSSGFIIG
jgi:hypothetical protein